MNALKVFDTSQLRNLLMKIYDKTQTTVIQIKAKLKRHELEIYNKWKILYKKCNPVDYLLNSSCTLSQNNCLRDCYTNIDKFLIFMQTNNRKVRDMLDMYDVNVRSLGTAAEHDDSIILRVIFLESEIIRTISDVKRHVVSFGKHGVLYVTPLRFYKLYEFVEVFIGIPLKLPTLNLDDTLNDLTIYLTNNKIEVPYKKPIYASTTTKPEIGVSELCGTRVCSRKSTDDKHEFVPNTMMETAFYRTDVCRQSGRSDKSNCSSMNLGDVSDSQFESMSVANSWFEDELKPRDDVSDSSEHSDDKSVERDTLRNTETSLFHELYNDNTIDDAPWNFQQVLNHSKIIYERLLQPGNEIIYDETIRTYVGIICKYLRGLYRKNVMQENVRGLPIVLPEYLRKVFRAVPVCGDGSCFYSAMSMQIIGDTTLAYILRVIIVYHMQINKWWILNNFYIDLDGNTRFDDVVKKSLLPNEYIDGGYPPVMMSIILHRPINIYGYARGTFVRINPWVFQSLKTHRPDQLSEFYVYLHDNHYTALELLKNDTSDIPQLDDYNANVFSTFESV